VSPDSVAKKGTGEDADVWLGVQEFVARLEAMDRKFGKRV
jgi:hypothetical protein